MKLLKLFSISIFIFVSSMCFCSCKTEQKTKKVEYIKNHIATMSIFTYDGKGESQFGLMNLGHSFLSISNTSQNDIVIGNYTLNSNESVCIGTWSIQEHFGVWYNVESNYIRLYEKYLGRISVTKYLEKNDIETICNFIATHDYWSPIYNCSYFAINLWNSVAKESEKLDTYFIYSPSKLSAQLKTFKNCQTNKSIKTDYKFGYFNETQYVSFNLEGDIYV